MPTTVVRAADSSEAMEQIVQRLGPDAMILSTVTRNGMVEITATNDPLPEVLERVKRDKKPSGAADAPSADVVQMPRHDSPGAQPVPNAAVAAPLPEAGGAPPRDNFAKLFQSRMNPVADPVAEDGGLPGADPTHPAVPGYADAPPPDVAPAATYSPPPPPEAPIAPNPAAGLGSGGAVGRADTRNHAELMRRITLREAPKVLAARRIILVGQVGAGKSILALQIAAEVAQSGTSVRVVYCGPSHADGAYLASKARLLGCAMGFGTTETLTARPPRDVGLEICVLSGRASLPANVPETIVEQDGTSVVLALPMGLRSRTVLAQAGKWRVLDPSITLIAGAGQSVEPEDLAALADATLPLTWVSATSAVVHTLCPVDPDRLASYLAPPIPPGVQNLYSTAPSFNGGPS